MLTLALLKSVLSFEPGPQRLLALSELGDLIKKKESAAYAADMFDMLRTMVHGQLECIIQLQSRDHAMEHGGP